MALTPPTNLLASQTVSSSFDQLLYLDSAAGLVEATLKVVGTDTGKSAIQIDDERLLVQGVDTSNAAAFEVKNTGGTSVFKVNASTAGTTTLGAVTVGVNDTGHDVKFFGASSGAYMLWDESQDDLIIGGAGRVGIGVTDPDSALEILNTSTQLKLSYDATNYATFDIAADGMLTITTVDPDGAEADIILAPDGNVGIGVAAPSDLLHIKGGDLFLEDTTDSPLAITPASDGEMFIKYNNAAGSLKGALIYNSSSDALTIRTANSPRITVLGDGKVGIGTATPAVALQVEVAQTSGDAEVLRLSSNNGTRANGDEVILTFYGDDSGGTSRKMGEISSRYVNTTSNGSTAMDFYTLAAGSEVASMTLDENGRVGIGTATPEANLEIRTVGAVGSATSGGYLRLSHDEGSTAEADEQMGRIDFAAADATPVMYVGASIYAKTAEDWTADSHGSELFFATVSDHISDSPPVVAMTIDRDQNVGIGTVDPGASLHIQVDATTASAPIEVLRLGILEATDIELAVGMGPSIDFYVPDTSTGSSTEKIGGRIAVVKENANDNNNEAGMSFYTSLDGSPSTEKVRIDKDGNVGIGTNDPAGLLEIKSATGADSEVIINTTDVDQKATLVLKENDVVKWFITNVGDGGDILDIIDASGDGVYLPQNQSGSLWTDSSDLNLKTDISVLSDALTKVNKLRGVNFKWKKYKSGASNPNPDDITSDRWADMRSKRDINRVGVIAQEVDEVLPEAVVKEKGDGNWGVQYTMITPLLIEAIKELSAEVDKLKGDA